MIHVAPITVTDALAYIGRGRARRHRHHHAPRTALWAVSARDGQGCIRGVATVEWPTAPALQDGYTGEVTRVCTDGARNACSLLYGACWRAAKAKGYRRLVTYTRIDEPGTSLRAAGWVATAIVKGRRHDTGNRASRWLPGLDAEATTDVVDRVRWEIGPAASHERAWRETG